MNILLIVHSFLILFLIFAIYNATTIKGAWLYDNLYEAILAGIMFGSLFGILSYSWFSLFISNENFLRLFTIIMSILYIFILIIYSYDKTGLKADLIKLRTEIPLNSK